MIIKSTKKATDLAPEGEYPAELKSVSYKNEGRKCILHFETGPDGKKQVVPKEVPSSFDTGPLRKDLELLNGAEFTTRQVEHGLDPEQFIGRKCRVLVVHKRTSGGRVVAVVSVLLPLTCQLHQKTMLNKYATRLYRPSLKSSGPNPGSEKELGAIGEGP